MPVRALARVNLAAIERNCARLRSALTPGSPDGPVPALCAVVKADGYGHGAAASARAALAGGASWLAVATAQEASELRSAGIGARLLVMGALTAEELGLTLHCDADVVAWREGFVDHLRRRAPHEVRVHVKLDSGMGRLGTRDLDEALRVADAVAAAPRLELSGLMTHFATADERNDTFFGEQLERFAAWVAEVRGRHPALVVHAANSAATLRDPASHFDMVRCGVGIYGLDPFGEDAPLRGLEPALELSSWVADVKRCARGESAGYGRRFIAERDTHLALLPVGYGDGWRRALTNNADILIRGRRHPLVGTVSMDNITVDVGSPSGAHSGDDAILIGADGVDRITAEEIARRLNTINYEVTCGLLPRVPRAFHRDGRPVSAAELAETQP